MPTYQYSCTECGHFFEQFQSFSEDSLTVCPQCQGRLRKVFNAVGVVFKGSGFYRTDSRGSSGDSGDSGDGGSSKKDGGSADKGSAGNSDTPSSAGSGGASSGGSTSAGEGSGKKAPAASGSSTSAA